MNGEEKENKYTQGNTGGRPPVFESTEELNAKISEYFSTRVPEYDSDHNLIAKNNSTVTGLALYLGFESRQSIYDNLKKDKFSYILKRAMLAIENGYEEGLQDAKPTGSIFALKNMGWKDEKVVDNKSSDHTMSPTDLSKYTDEEKAILLKFGRNNEPID